MKPLLLRCLRLAARAVLRVYDPIIVGVTGSVGKTSTKSAIASVLGAKFRVRADLKNYNNEIGVPLSIIGAETGGRSLFAWMTVFMKALGLLLFRSLEYPDILVLEMGADKPGDIAYLVSLAPCRVAVVTAVSPAHTEFFGSVENVRKEKGLLVSHLPPDGTAVLNADDPAVASMRDNTSAKVIMYGFSERADVRANDAVLSKEGGDRWVGMRCDVETQQERAALFIPGAIGHHQVSAALAAAAVGLSFGLTLTDAALGLRSYRPPPGRGTLLSGIKQTLIIDDSYNSSPAAAHAALVALATFPSAKRRIACLGEMAELGPLSKEEHVRLGRRVAELHLDRLFTVGENAHVTADAARDAGLPAERIASFPSATEAGLAIQKDIAPGDVLLVKGSQVSRTEHVVKELMAEPERAQELLVRQGPEWQR